MQLSLITKQFKISGVFGAGKDKMKEKEDPTGWSRDKAHLYGGATQAAANSLCYTLPEEVVGVIVDEAEAPKPIILAEETSLLPSPKPEKPGYMYGGWIIIGLEPEETKGDSKGFVRLSMLYRTCDGKEHKVEKDVDVSEAENARREGRFGWASDEGMEKAMVLKQYVDVMKNTLDDVSAKAFPPEFEAWFQPLVEKFELQKEKERVVSLSRILQK